MYTATILVPLILHLAGTALAKPMPVSPNRRNTCGVPVDTTISPTGNLTVHFSDNKISLGDQDPTDLFKKVQSQCADAGSCNPNAWTGKGQEPGNPGGLENVDISMIAHGLYPVWIHNGLYDALMTALSKAIDKQTKKYTPSTSCTSSIGCFGSSDKSIDVYTIPDWIAVYWYDPNDCNADPAYMGVETSVKVEGSGGFCGTFSTLGGALASSMQAPPGAGIFFSLLGLSCSLAGQ
ncbi:hypothetical protein SCUP234_03226 [Seiridium cupressi]